MYRTILLATDGSDDALGAIERAVDLAVRYGATLEACYVIETRTAYDDAIVDPEAVDRALYEEGEDALAAVRGLATVEGVPVPGAIRRGVPRRSCSNTPNATGRI